MADTKVDSDARWMRGLVISGKLVFAANRQRALDIAERLEMIDRVTTGISDLHRISCADNQELKARLATLEQQRKRLREACAELIDAMERYEIDVDVESPRDHRQMMERAWAALEDTL